LDTIKSLRYLVCGAVFALLLAGAAGAAGPSSLRLISTDSTTGGGAQHQTEVEPDVDANGSTIVSAFQVGRFNPGGGSMGTGWATSTNGGASWQHGTLPSFTTSSVPAGTYERTADNTVAYDATHGVWLIASLGIRRGRNDALVVSRSSDALSWSAPIVVSSAFQPDKDWIECDNNPSSPGKGTCYAAWSDLDRGVVMAVSRSTDGGVTWSAPVTSSPGYNVQLVVQPNGTVVVAATAGGRVIAIRSTDQGRSFGPPVVVSQIQGHAPASRFRVEGSKPSVRTDGQGVIYAVWSDCRFRAGCRSNDLVLSTSTDGVTWSPVTRIPIEAVSGLGDYFLPGLGADPATGGSTAHLGLVYYFISNAKCTFACPLYAGFISSNNGGKSWFASTVLTPQMKTTWLAPAQNFGMVGDYFSTAYTSGRPVTVVAVASAPQGQTFNQNMYAALPAQTPVAQLTASVGPGRAISLRPSTASPGQYTVVVRDRTRVAGFHLKGPGVNRATGRTFTGTATWHLTLKAGNYRFFSDARGSRGGVLKVG
jgi:BNR repeat protein